MVKNSLSKIFFIISLIFISGCATLYNPATGKNEFIMIDSQSETAIGKNIEAELLRNQHLSNDVNLKTRVMSIGEKLARVSDRQDLKYQFDVVEDKQLNAVSLPGGIIYINSGLARILTDDELAFVIGHELGHVAARHIVKKLQANMAYNILLSVAFSAAVNEENKDTAEGIAKGVNTAYGLVELKYSRNDEYEADRLGVRYMRKAGYNPYESLSALDKIKEKGQKIQALEFFRTHPYIEDRIETLRKILAQPSQS